MDNKRITEYIEENEQLLITYLLDMVAINTENDGKRAHEKALAEYLYREYGKLGIEGDIYSPDSLPGVREHPDYLPGRNLGDRTNFTAKLSGRTGAKALMLAGHMDTVPIGDLNNWTVDPMGALSDGRVYGRGACDDKYALAVSLFIVRMFKDLGIRLENDLYLTGYVDEEFGGGDGALSCALKYPCDLYVNMDGHDFEVWNCASGGQRVVLNISSPEPLDDCGSVIEGLYISKKQIEVFGQRRIAELKADPLFSDSSIPDSAIRILNIGSGLNTTDRNKGFIDFAFYTNKPREAIKSELSDLLDCISSRIAPVGLKVNELYERSRFFKHGHIDPDHPAIALLRRAAGDRQIPVCAGCLSDLSLFFAAAPGKAFSFGAGRPFDVCGGAHQPDEFISCDVLKEYCGLMAQFILLWDTDGK